MFLLPAIAASRRRIFDPLSLSPALWLDASDSSTLFDATSGGSLVAADGAVARWEDKSGNGRHATQATSGYKPVRKTSIQNARDVVRWASGSRYHMVTGLSYLQSEIEIFVAWNKTGSNTNVLNDFGTIIGGSGPDAGASSRWAVNTDNTERRSAQFRMSSGATNVTFITGLNLPSGGEILRLQGSFSASSVAGSRNGAALTSASITTGTSFDAGSFVIGGPVPGFSNFSVVGDLYEILIFLTALSTADRQKVEQYLAAKWGITLA